MKTPQADGLLASESAVNHSECCNSGCTVCVLDYPLPLDHETTGSSATCAEPSELLDAIRLACALIDQATSNSKEN